MRSKKFALSMCVVFCLIAIGRTTALAQSSQPAGERLCDTSFEDCRTPLINMIRAETVGIDAAWWFMEDSRYATEIIKRWQAGVPVRIIIDPRANTAYPTNAQMLQMVKDAGIPMRYKLKDGILHWKMMLFDGQGKVEFSSANYSPHAFKPEVPYVDYVDEVIYFTDDAAVVNSFRTKYDDLWVNTSAYRNYANIATGTTLLRRYATFSINAELNFPPGGKAFADRAVAAYRAEGQKIDVIMYRITDDRHTNEMIAAVGRGVPVRLMHEPDESYRNPTYAWDSYNVDRMYMAGVQIKMRKHLGQTHEKLMLMYAQGLAVHASSNWSTASSNSQQEHNYFTKKGWFFQWYVNHFERKWNAAEEFEDFVPLPPDRPVHKAPVNGAQGLQTTSVQLQWEGGYWAHKYDVYVGTDPAALALVAADVTWDGRAAGPSYVEDYVVTGLQPGVKYYWKIVGKTMANMVRSASATWNFTTAGAAPTAPAAPNALQASAASSSQINLSWGDASVDEDGFTIERSTDNASFGQVASVGAGVTAYADGSLLSAQTYYYRVRAYNAAGTSGYSNTASAQTASQTAAVFDDNFNDNSRDTTKWRASGLEVAGIDPAVLVREQNQRLEITPLANLSGSHSNGYSSVKRYDLTSRSAAVEVVQTANTGSSANTFFILINGNNWFRFGTEDGKLLMQQAVAGSMTGVVLSYSATQHRHWRIRHDAAANVVVWETSGDGVNWTVRRSEALRFAISALRLELYARTWKAESSPGVVIFDNVRLK